MSQRHPFCVFVLVFICVHCLLVGQEPVEQGAHTIGRVYCQGVA